MNRTLCHVSKPPHVQHRSSGNCIRLLAIDIMGSAAQEPEDHRTGQSRRWLRSARAGDTGCADDGEARHRGSGLNATGGAACSQCDDHPFSAEFLARVHMALNVVLDAITHVRRALDDLDGTHRVHADMDTVSLAHISDALDASRGSVSIAL